MTAALQIAAGPTPNSAAWFRNRLIRDGICRAIYEEMERDSSIYLFGEGAQMKVHYDAPDIERDFGNRVTTLPISEDGNTNFCVGTSLIGLKPIVDVITADFLFRTMDSICNTAAKINFVSGGSEPARTIVIRSEFMVFGPTTGQRLESLFTHIPGLTVVVPANPTDAAGLMKTALRRKGVTIFFEDRMIPDATTKEEEKKARDVPPIPFGKSKIRRQGLDVTVVSYGLTLRQVEHVSEKYGLDCEIIDLRTVYPVDFDSIYESVVKTRNLLIIEPDIKYAGVGAEIAAFMGERCFGLLEKPIMRLGAPRSTIPTSQFLHKEVLVTDNKILAAMITFQTKLTCSNCGKSQFEILEEEKPETIKCSNCGQLRASSRGEKA